jgi:hypothetical protein
MNEKLGPLACVGWWRKMILTPGFAIKSGKLASWVSKFMRLYSDCLLYETEDKAWNSIKLEAYS